MEPRKLIAAGALALLALAGCSETRDAYYEELDDAGWATGPLAEDEREDMYEQMAAQVCGEIRDSFNAGNDESTTMARVLPLIDSSDPTSDRSVAALDAMLDHRCDASQADGLKAD